MPTAIPNDNAVVSKCGAQQESPDKNGQDSHDDKSHRRPSITSQCQDELNEAATRSEQTSSNYCSIPVSLSYMATKGKNGATYPVINDVRTLQAPEQGITHQGGMSTVVHSPPSEQSGQTNNSTTQPVYNGQMSLKNTQIIPQRPQDLLDHVSLDMARENVKSSAQYRKSYAFKIWRDRGSFPYRLAEQPVVKEVVQRKKSKKYLNAVRAQRDRDNEEAWKTFKSCKTTTNEMRYRRTSKFPRIRVEETLSKHYDKEQLNTILSQDNDPRGNNMKQQNSIPDYFKNKKESAQKSQPLASPNKSIPTSVIHVHAKKACEVSEQTTQAEQIMSTSDDGGYNGNVLKPTTQAEVQLESNPTSKRKLLPSKVGGISQWSDTQTSSVGKYNIHVQSQEQLNANAVNGRQQISAEIMTESSADSSSSLEGSILPDMQSKQENRPSKQENRPSKQHNSLSLFTTSNALADNSLQSGEDTELLSTYLNGNAISDQSPTTSPTVEASEIDDSNLASMIKNSLAKKYSKENVKPNFGSAPVERGRKRTRNEPVSSEEGERQRARMKQQKATMFTRLDEAVATNLADGIHNVNSEYFPIEALAKKAAKETSKAKGVSDDLERKLETTSIKHKLDEIERARLLLKELFDVTSESGGDNEMKTFDDASRSFGRKNILNHLSLIDRYFAEFQKKLSSSDRPALLP